MDELELFEQEDFDTYDSKNNDRHYNYNRFHGLVSPDVVKSLNKRNQNPRRTSPKRMSRKECEKQTNISKKLKTLRNWNLGFGSPPSDTDTDADDYCHASAEEEEEEEYYARSGYESSSGSSISVPVWLDRITIDENNKNNNMSAQSFPSEIYIDRAKGSDDDSMEEIEGEMFSYGDSHSLQSPLGSFKEIGVGPNDLSYTVPSFKGKQPLRKDGTEVVPEKDNKFYGPKYRKEFYTRKDKIENDKFVVFLRKLAGATNTQIENLYSLPDLETRSLRMSALLDAQKADTRARFERIRTVQKTLERLLREIDTEEEKLDRTTVGKAEAETATFLRRQLLIQKETYNTVKVNVERLKDYDTINNEFSKLIGKGDVPDLTGEKIRNAMNRRLKSMIDFKPTSIKISPALRKLLNGNENEKEMGKNIREQANQLDLRKDIEDRNRMPDLLFLGIWILYEIRDEISRQIEFSDDATFKETVENLLQILAKQKGKPFQTDGSFGFTKSPVNFESIDEPDRNSIIQYIETEIKTVYPTETGRIGATNINTVLTELIRSEETALERQLSLLVGNGVEAIRFLSAVPNIPGAGFGESIRKRLLDAEAFQTEESPDTVQKNVDEILDILRRLIQSRKEDVEDIVKNIQDKRDRATRLRREIDVLLTQPLATEEPEIPYRPEGSWVFNPINSGRFRLAEIVVYAIEQAYKKVEKYVPELGASDPTNDESISKAISTLQTNPLYRTHFVNIVAREMGMARQSFNVRWMPDLTGDHKRVIRNSIFNLREISGKNVGAHFERVLRVM